MSVPNDPVILLSYINTQLRDFYPSLEKLGDMLDVDIKELQNKLSSIGYKYDASVNRFV